MRDLAVALLFAGLIPVILRYPWIGVLVYAWVSLFSPHRHAWGYAYDFQLAMITGVTIVAAMVLHWREVRFPVNATTVLLVLLPVWMTITLVFALEPDNAYERWVEVMKTFFFALIAASLLHTRKQLEAFLWVIVGSIGFYGIKGGIFTLLADGRLRVYGPPGESFLSDNNAIGAALVMIIPLMHYLTTTVSSKWIRLGLYGAMLLSGLAVLGTQSRGAFVGILAMVAFLWLKSKSKLVSAPMLLVAGALALNFMPEQWWSRMSSIANYEQDTSAMGRLNSWSMLFHLANDRLTGGGFEPYEPRTFAMYAPDPTAIHSAHSIYFQMLGEHGYIGLALFAALGIVSWMAARRLIRAGQERPEHAWAEYLGRAMQVSMVGFASAGLFVNIAYWEVVYYEVVILMAANRLLETAEGGSQVSVTAADHNALPDRAQSW